MNFWWTSDEPWIWMNLSSFIGLVRWLGLQVAGSPNRPNPAKLPRFNVWSLEGRLWAWAERSSERGIARWYNHMSKCYLLGRFGQQIVTKGCWFETEPRHGPPIFGDKGHQFGMPLVPCDFADIWWLTLQYVAISYNLIVQPCVRHSWVSKPCRGTTAP